MKILADIHKSINELESLKNNITEGLKLNFKEEEQSVVCETAAEVLKVALQALQTGQTIEDPALVGGLLVLAKGEVRKDLDIGPQKLGLYANYAGRSDRINQELRRFGAGAKVDADRLQTDEKYRSDIMMQLQKLVGAYDKVAKEAHKGAEQVTAQPAI